MSKTFQRFLKNESGATAIEYALIAGIMAVALVAAFGAFTPKLTTGFTNIGSQISAAPAK
ncbi:Flp family type IVb pilin [Fulvimarina sp. 2208YS6-2-32]|uniref:Flp family type IVb pilin n=1 Tax=Fulvimarina uroteuthidis TaxID=3098149 RepID=A0ABU5I2R3_9HYPH|nr:Flp family type IVb pilin [Fulvimarina sp. 2208YS6-2-32]MDY8108456.1 Flp family type IVb pilin [Fulvimarina sp. 2208YS6-2-32]